jgi:hypothetical protein
MFVLNSQAVAPDEHTLAQLRFEIDATTDDISRVWTNPLGLFSSGARTTSSPKYGTGCLVGAADSGFVPNTAIMQTAPISTIPTTGLDAATVEGWITADTSTNAAAGFGFEQVGGGSGARFSANLFSNVDGTTMEARWGATDTNGTLIFQREATPVTKDANWHHVAATFDGTTYRLFLDGSLVDSFSSSTKPCDETTAAHVVFNRASVGPPDSKLDSVRFSKVCRYAANFSPVDIM